MINTENEHAKWKKPDTEDHILDDSMYLKCPEQTNVWQQKVDEWLLMAGEEEWEWLLKGAEFLLGMVKMFWN